MHDLIPGTGSARSPSSTWESARHENPQRRRLLGCLADDQGARAGRAVGRQGQLSVNQPWSQACQARSNPNQTRRHDQSRILLPESAAPARAGSIAARRLAHSFHAHENFFPGSGLTTPCTTNSRESPAPPPLSGGRASNEGEPAAVPTSHTENARIASPEAASWKYANAQKGSSNLRERGG